LKLKSGALRPPDSSSQATAVIRRKCACGSSGLDAGGTCAECEKDKRLQRKVAGSSNSPAWAFDSIPMSSHDEIRQIPAIQKKLTIGSADDPLEHEADRVADQVMQMAGPQLQRSRASGGTPDSTGEFSVRRKNQFIVQRKCPQSSAETPAIVPSSVHQVLSLPGLPLDAATRAFLEPRFGHDFSRVRVHSDVGAAQSARALNAKAYTVGNHIVFGAGRFKPETTEGLTLLAHELTHVVQQGGANRGQADGIAVRKTSRSSLMRSVALDSTVSICHRVLQSREVIVSKGGLRVVLLLRPLDQSVPGCVNHSFSIELSSPRTLLPDKRIASCEGQTGGTVSFVFGDLSPGTYYFTIARDYDNPNCCMEGDVLAFDEPANGNSPGCEKHKSLTTLEIVHGALDIVGLIPALGAIPDGINAVIYGAEGDWINAGISVAAAVPFLGDGVIAAKWGGKTAIKISEKAAIRLGEEGIAKGLKEARAVAKAEKAAADTAKDVAKGVEGVEKGTEKAAGAAGKEAEEAAKKAAEKALQERIKTCLEIYAVKEALGACKACKPTDTPAERAAKIACLTAEIAAREKYLREDCDDVLPGSLERVRRGQDPKKGHQTQLAEKIVSLAKCSTMPTK
jgi:hypothetical protein